MVSLYEEIVGRGGIAPDYFFDRMDFAECVAFLNGMRRKERAELEKDGYFTARGRVPAVYFRERFGLPEEKE